MEKASNINLERVCGFDPGTYKVTGELESRFELVCSLMYCCRTRRSDPIRQPWVTFVMENGERIQASVMSLAIKDKSGYNFALGGKVRRLAPEKYKGKVKEQWFKGEFDFRTNEGELTIGIDPMF